MVLPVGDEQAQAGWPGLANEDGGQDGGEHDHGADQVQAQPQPPRAALQHQGGRRVCVNLKGQNIKF